MGYPGGKNGSGVYQRIISLMPPHRVYIEPFLGGGAIFRAKRPAELNIGIELDSEVAGRWILPSEVAAKASAGESSGGRPSLKMAASAGAGRSGGARGPVFLAAAAAAVVSGDSSSTVGVSGGARRRSLDLAAVASVGGFDGGARADLVGPLYLAAPEGAAGTGGAGSGDGRSSGARSRWEIRQGDGIEFLRRYPFRGDELMYCDPPYMRSTRSGGRLYACEMSDGAHRKLLKVLLRLPCMVMISGYWSELYGAMLAGWRSISFEACTRGGMATEHLWMNFPPAVQLHDYSYLGSNRREREQLKRQKARWVARLTRMDELKRGALLLAIQEYSAARNGGEGPRRCFWRRSTSTVAGSGGACDRYCRYFRRQGPGGGRVMGMKNLLNRTWNPNDMASLAANMVDRHRDGLYDRVQLSAGIATPRMIECFQYGIGTKKRGGKYRDWSDTNMYGNGELNAPYNAIVSRFLLVFQPGGARADEHAFLRNYTWEFVMLHKCFQRHPLMEFAVKGNIADVIQKFGSEDCRGKLERFAVPYAYNLGELARYIPPLVGFKVSLVGEPFVPEQAMDFYSILDGTTDWPVQ